MRMDQEVVGYELLDTNLRRDGEQVSRHYVVDIDPVECLGHLGLFQAGLSSRPDNPAQEDSPQAVEDIPSHHHQQ